MNPLFNSSPLTLAQKVNYVQEEQVTGQIEVKSTTKKEWVLYFCLGRIIWSDSNFNSYRSWIRLLAKSCPQVKVNKNLMALAQKFQGYKYRLLILLWKNDKITREQLISIIETQISETIFDIIQQEITEPLQYNFHNTSGDFLLASGLEIYLTPTNKNQIFQQSYQNWLAWRKVSERVRYICNLEKNGKLSPKEAYEKIKLLWQEMKDLREQLRS